MTEPRYCSALGKKRVGVSLFALMVALAFVPGEAHAGITKTAVWNGAYGVATCYTAGEDAISQASAVLWDVPQKIFSNPVSIDMFKADGDIDHIFILDKSQGRFRYFGTKEKLLYFFKNYTNGPQLNCPKGIAVQPDQPESGWNKLFVLDSGNDAVRQYEVNRNAHNINYIGDIYSSTVNGGHGPLKGASDIAYCWFFSQSCDRLVVVADTYNHRVLIMKTDGTVIHEVGGPAPGSGPGQFRYPKSVAAVGLNDQNCQAFIYVADRGNNRIVCLYLDENQAIHWYRTRELPADEGDVGTSYPAHGIEKIAVDDWYKDGVWILDSRQRGAVQFDQFLEQQIQFFNGMDYKGANPKDISIHAGQMAFIGPYTRDTGLELFELKASFFDIEAYPNPFDPYLEWLTLKFVSSAHAYVIAWIKNSSGETILSKENFADTMFVFPSVNYLVWDGKDDDGNVVPPGEYAICLQLKDAAWGTTESTHIHVMVGTSPIRVLATHKVIVHPKWAPDGTHIAYSADDNLPYNMRIAKVDVADSTETFLTQEDLGNTQPSWSPGSDKIAFTKWTHYLPVFDYWEAGIFTMDAGGQNLQVVSDTSLAWNRCTDPSWIRGGDGISYIRHNSDAQVKECILTQDLITAENMTVYSAVPLGEQIYRHLWSPLGDEIAMSLRTQTEDWHHLYSYNPETAALTQLTYSDEGGADEERSFAYLPDGRKVGFLEKLFNFGNESWKILTVPSGGGTKIPVGGLASSIIDAGPGIAWSPDGTKIAFVLRYVDCDRLVLADYIRNASAAFPAAFITRPFQGSEVHGTVTITGSVGDNVSINGDTVLCDMGSYQIEYGSGMNPSSWRNSGIELAKDCSQGDCQVSNDTLAQWNTGLLPSGIYTLRLMASGGANSNVVYRSVTVSHRVIQVKKNGLGDFTAIQAAIDAAEQGDTVLVYAGDYAEHDIAMKEMVHLIGAEAGVYIINGNSTALKVVDHEHACTIRNITIRNETCFSWGVGLLVDNASPTISDCLIQNQGNSNGAGCGIGIGGNARPTFFSCTIRDNKASYGAGLRISVGDDEYPAPSFYHCSFINNVANGSGGAAYLGYSYTTPLDTAHAQPYFNGCIFSDNITMSTGYASGSAVSLSYCHAASFTHCSFLNNRPYTIYGNPVCGDHGGASFTNCTFYENGGEEEGSVLDFGFLSAVGNDAVRVNNCIFAFNDIEAIQGDDNYFDVNHTCFFNGQSGDDAWLARDQGNFAADPGFCDPQNGDLHLFSYSPCAPNVSGLDLIGAFAVGCTPSADIYPGNPNAGACPPNSCADNPTIYVCPGGDMQRLVVHVGLDTLDMTRSIESTEIELLPPTSEFISFWCDEHMYADSAATAGNHWRTTISYDYISAKAPSVPCAQCSADTLHVMLDNLLLGSFKVRFKSPDANGPGGRPDGKVNLSDLVPFGSTYNKCLGNPAFNDCFNYSHSDSDTCVNMSDFGEWGSHYGPAHDAPCIGPAAQMTQGALSDVALRFAIQLETIDRERYANIGINLENARGVTASCLLLDGGPHGLDFVKWVESKVDNGSVLGTSVERDGVKQLLVCLLAGSPTRSSSLCLGTVRYRLRGDIQPPFDERMSLLAFGEVMKSDGIARSLLNTRVQVEDEVATYYDYLKSCYPNPFNPSTTIEYSIARDSHVNLSIYNANGQLLRTLVNADQKRNAYRVTWDGNDNEGRGVAAGIYFCRMKSDFFEKSQKLIMLR